MARALAPRVPPRRQLIKELAASLQPGSSAIFVLVRRVTADKVVPEFARFGGRVLRSSLSVAQEQKLQAALEGGSETGVRGAPAGSL